MRTYRSLLCFKNWGVVNYVGNGQVIQDGVHLSDLLRSEGDKCHYVPVNCSIFHYKGTLSNGTQFSANITDGAKINIMGVPTRRIMFDAFESVKHLISHFEDPEAPQDPRKRFEYRMNQLLETRTIQLPKRSKKRKRKQNTDDDDDAELLTTL